MSDAKKAALKITKDLLSSRAPSAGLPPGFRVETNSGAVSRFPLVVALPSALMVAIGIVAAWKGHRALGVIVGGAGAVGIGAAAAAPELIDQIHRMQGKLV